MPVIAPPTRIGLILYPEFEVLDVFGPIEALNTISRINPAFTPPPPLPPTPLTVPLSLSIIASTMEPVVAGQGEFKQSFVPTHTFETAPKDLEVLICPGGTGDSDDASEFIKERFRGLRYLITVCTGANIAARAGVLRGCRATTNKKAWVFLPSLSPSSSPPLTPPRRNS
jgi:putative intracellular protease/amidase